MENNEKDYNGYNRAQRLAILEQCEEITESEQEQRFRDMLDDTYGEVDIAGMKYQTSRVLEEVDPTAFRCGVRDYFGNGDFVEVYEKIEDGTMVGGLYEKEEADEVAESVDEDEDEESNS